MTDPWSDGSGAFRRIRRGAFPCSEMTMESPAIVRLRPAVLVAGLGLVGRWPSPTACRWSAPVQGGNNGRWIKARRVEVIQLGEIGEDDIADQAFRATDRPEIRDILPVILGFDLLPVEGLRAGGLRRANRNRHGGWRWVERERWRPPFGGRRFGQSARPEESERQAEAQIREQRQDQDRSRVHLRYGLDSTG